MGSIHRDPCQASRSDTVIQHPSLEIWNNSVQTLSSRYMRRLITMVKVKDFNAAASAEWRKSLVDKELPIDKLQETIYERRDPSAVPKGKKQRYRGKGH